MRYRKSLLGYLCIIIAAVIYGLMPIAAKVIYTMPGISPLTGEAGTVNSLSLVFLRNLCALPVLALFAKMGGASFKVAPKTLWRIVGIGILGSCATPVLLFTAYQFLPGGTATVLHQTYPAVVVLGGILFLKKKTHYKQLLCLGLCLAGVAVMYNPADPINLTGAAIALLSGVVYGSYIILLSVFPDKSISGFLFNFFAGISIVVIMLVLCLATCKLYVPATSGGWWLAVLFSLAVNVGAVILFQKGTFLIGGSRASILGNLETVTSIVADVAVGIAVTWQSWVSMALIMSASILIAVFDAQKQRKE